MLTLPKFSGSANNGFAIGPYAGESEVCFKFSEIVGMGNGARFFNGDGAATPLASGAELDGLDFCVTSPAPQINLNAIRIPEPVLTGSPTGRPTSGPTGSPTFSPSVSPTTQIPTDSPTGSPTIATKSPTSSPTGSPTGFPTHAPTDSPTVSATDSPTVFPTGSPTGSPTYLPTDAPTGSPTRSPTGSPTGCSGGITVGGAPAAVCGISTISTGGKSPKDFYYNRVEMSHSNTGYAESSNRVTFSVITVPFGSEAAPGGNYILVVYGRPGDGTRGAITVTLSGDYVDKLSFSDNTDEGNFYSNGSLSRNWR